MCAVAVLSTLDLPRTVNWTSDYSQVMTSHAPGMSSQGGSWLLGTAHADVIAPQAPPELSDTLKDFRTKEQKSEKIYIEGRNDPQNSVEVPTVPGDAESKVMRMSATYQAQYEVAVPRHGVSIIRFYDLNGYPMDIVSSRVENQGFIAETTAAPSELMVRQFQGASATLLQVRLKGINQSFLFTLKPLTVINQQSSVRTLITSMTVNYYVDGNTFIQPEPYRFGKPNPAARAINYDKVSQDRLEVDMLEAVTASMPLNKDERDAGMRLIEEQIKKQQ